MSKSDKIFQSIKEAVHNIAPGAEIYLFGSRARQTASENSDWDILVLIDSNEISFLFETQIMDQIYEVELKYGVVITPIIYTQNDWLENHSITPFFENVNREGVKI